MLVQEVIWGVVQVRTTCEGTTDIGKAESMFRKRRWCVGGRCRVEQWFWRWEFERGWIRSVCDTFNALMSCYIGCNILPLLNTLPG